MRINKDQDPEENLYEGIEPYHCVYCGEQMLRKEGFCDDDCELDASFEPLGE